MGGEKRKATNDQQLDPPKPSFTAMEIIKSIERSGWRILEAF